MWAVLRFSHLVVDCPLCPVWLLLTFQQLSLILFKVYMTRFFFMCKMRVWNLNWSKILQKLFFVFNSRKDANSPVSSSLWPLNYRSEDAFLTSASSSFFTSSSIWSSLFTNSKEKKTCLLLYSDFKRITCRNFWIFYFMSRLTVYECVVNVCIHR